MSKKILLLTITIMIGLAGLFFNIQYSFAGIVSYDVAALMKQGEIHRCLTPGWSGEIPRGSRGTGKINMDIGLTGMCDSPTGCTCLFCWGGSHDEAYIARANNCALKPEDVVIDPVVLASLPSKGITEAEYRLKQVQACARLVSESKDLVLVNPGCKPCNITKNKNPYLGKETASVPNQSQVLGIQVGPVFAQGPVEAAVQEDIYRHTGYDFSAVYPAPIEGVDMGTGGETITGEAKTQQLGSFGFKFEDFTSEGMEESCKTIYWDPFGRVFDSLSLEPISLREVTLIDDSTGKPVVMRSSLNYDITGEDGLFNILVEKEGSYHLKVDQSSIHEFKSNPILSPNWSKIYSDLYYKGTSFIEKVNVPTHHDIPLQPKGSPYRGAVAQLIPNTLKSQNTGSHIVYSGRNTFPMAKICLKDEDMGKIIGHCVNANNIGIFTLAIPKDQVPGKKLIIDAEKVDLNNPNIYKKNQIISTINDSSSFAFKAVEKYYFEPILSHVEGYVYDSNGNPIPNAEVLVKLANNNELIHKTKADDYSFFTIYTKDLPFLEYYLEFIDPKTQTRIKKTPSQFISENKQYLNLRKINLMSATKDSQPIVNSVGESKKVIDNDSPAKKNSQTTLQKITLKKLTIIIFILIVLFLSVLGTVFYIKNKTNIS